MSILKLDDASYFSLNAINNSTLSRLAKCPAAMKTEISQTPQMSMGTLCHALLLEGYDAFVEVLKERYTVMPDCAANTKEGKAQFKEWLREMELPEATTKTSILNGEVKPFGKSIVTPQMLHNVNGMATSIISHPFAKDLLSEGQPEMAVTWEKEGIKCKAKIDWLGKHLIDLKTTQDATEYTFQRTIINSRYHNQMAWYYDGLRANLRGVDGVFIIAVENKEPYTCNVFQITDEMLEWGRASYMPLLRKYKECLANNQFPSYQYAGAIEVNPPAWVSL